LRQNQAKNLLNYLKTKDTGVYLTTGELSLVLKISQRQVQNYLTEIISQHPDLLLCDKQCYALNPKLRQQLDELYPNLEQQESPESRRNYILQSLVRCKTLKITDLAEFFYVAEATIDADVQKARKYVAKYQLQINKENGILSLLGNEKDIRGLMRNLLLVDNSSLFTVGSTLQQMFAEYDLPALYQILNTIFTKHEVFVNDYSFNNVALHIIIMIERLSKGEMLNETVDLTKIQATRQLNAVDDILNYIENKYQLTTNESELYNLVLLISSNSSLTNYAVINAQNIEKHIDAKYIAISRQLLRSVEKTYDFLPFNQEFIANFSIHIKNVFQRQQYNTKTKNPLLANVKLNYPFVYDVAVFIAQLLKNDYGITIDENEIAYLSFHIGSYFENTNFHYPKVRCLIIFSDYYGYYQKQIRRIHDIFSEDINVVAALPATVDSRSINDIDLVISFVNYHHEKPTIIVNPILTEKDIAALQTSIKKIAKMKRSLVLRDYLNLLFHEDLFYCNLDLADEIHAIKVLSKDIIEKGYADEGYTFDLLERERMSSTAFNNLAIPHCLHSNANESFLAFAIPNKPIKWSDKAVDLVILIGINENSKEIFAQAYDSLVEILSEPLNIAKLVEAKNYKQFLNTLLSTMSE